MKTGPWNLSELKDWPKHNKTVFSCFHCGGGSTMGYKLAGYDVLGGVEIDSQMMGIYKKNHNPKHSYLMSIVDFNKIPNEKLPKELFELDILDGSPPCSSFSSSGLREKTWGKKKKFREGQTEQILDDLFFHFIDTIEKLNPKISVIENVKGLIQGNAKSYVKEIYKKINSIGYNVQLLLLNSAFMGVPQRRERVFFVASKKSLNLKKIEMKFNEEQISLKKAFESIEKNKQTKQPTITPYIKSFWEKCKPGHALSSVHEKGHLFNWSRESMNKPCRTFASTSARMILHPEEPRPFNDDEIKIIQSFPDDYCFVNTDAGYVCGMSVPPFMMQRISFQIYKQWLC